MTHDDETLIDIPFFENGREVVHYFFSDAEADAATGEQAVQNALGLAGFWSDLDWDEMQEGLDCIRHQSLPTPPFEL
jgi:hypothetical protein